MKKAITIGKGKFPDSLLGTWKNEHFLAKWTILATEKGLVVKGIDSETGDQFKISNVSWTHNCVRFTSLYPPTGRVVEHECRALSNSEMMVTLSYKVREVWARKELPEGFPRSKDPSLAGWWHNPNGADFRILCRIGLTGKRPSIRIEDIGDGELSRVRKVRWEGQSLIFDTKVPSTGQVCNRAFTPISLNRVSVNMRFKESYLWKKVGG